MRIIEKDQWNRLLKIRIKKQGKDQWELRCMTDKKGNQIRKGEIIFRGSEEQFKLLLRRLKASDIETTPAGTKNITYQQMIDLAKNPKGNYIWVKTKNWNSYNNGKQLMIKESQDRFEVKPVKGLKFYHKDGYTIGDGFGVYDKEVNKFVSDGDKNRMHPWDYKKKSIAQDIVDQFNKFGPLGPIYYSVPLNENVDLSAEDLFILRNKDRMDLDTLIGVMADKFNLDWTDAENIVMKKNKMKKENIIKVQKDFRLPNTEIIIKKDWSIKIIESMVYHHVLNMDLEKYTLNASIKKRVNKELADISSPPYYTEIPLDDIIDVLKRYGIVLLQEDLSEWSGLLLGDSSETSIAIGDYTTADRDAGYLEYKPYTNSVLRISWYKMQSGKYEVICYLT